MRQRARPRRIVLEKLRSRAPPSKARRGPCLERCRAGIRNNSNHLSAPARSTTEALHKLRGGHAATLPQSGRCNQSAPSERGWKTSRSKKRRLRWQGGEAAIDFVSFCSNVGDVSLKGLTSRVRKLHHPRARTDPKYLQSASNTNGNRRRRLMLWSLLRSCAIRLSESPLQ